MTMQALYPSKKELKANVGQPLRYKETSSFGKEYRSTGCFNVCNQARTWWATVTMENGLISRVA